LTTCDLDEESEYRNFSRVIYDAKKSEGQIYDKMEEYVTSSGENEVHLSVVVTEIQAMLARRVEVKPG
jgi:hypothetical protein